MPLSSCKTYHNINEKIFQHRGKKTLPLLLAGIYTYIYTLTILKRKKIAMLANSLAVNNYLRQPAFSVGDRIRE